MSRKQKRYHNLFTWIWDDPLLHLKKLMF